MSSVDKNSDEKDLSEVSYVDDVSGELYTVSIDQLPSTPGFEEAVRLAYEREHRLGFREAVKMYPGAFWWSLAISFTIVMEGYCTFLLGNFFGYPSFVKKYGTYYPDKGAYVIPTNWQAALLDVGSAGGIVGLLLMGLVSDRIGYRYMIMLGLSFIVGFNFITFFAPNVQILTVAMFLSGIPTGFFGILGCAYASEVAPLALRGFLTSFCNICWVIGQLVATGVLNGLIGNPTEWSYRIPFALIWAWPIPVFLIALFAPNSPWWCTRKGKHAAAEKALKRLSSGASEVQLRQNLCMMIHTDQIEKSMKTKASLLDCFKGTNLRRTEIACLTLAVQPMSGLAFAYGSTFFFLMAGFSPDNAYKLNVGCSAVAFVGTCVSWIIMIWFGRRTLIIGGLCAMAVCLLIIGCLDFASTQAALWTQAALTMMWLFIYSATIGPQAFALASEVSAVRLRSQTVALSRMANVAFQLVTTTVEPYLINPTAADLKGKTAFVWVGTAIVAIIWCAFRMPEVKGLTYAELDVLFEKRVPAWRFKKVKVDAMVDSHING